MRDDGSEVVSDTGDECVELITMHLKAERTSQVWFKTESVSAKSSLNAWLDASLPMLRHTAGFLAHECIIPPVAKGTEAVDATLALFFESNTALRHWQSSFNRAEWLAEAQVSDTFEWFEAVGHRDLNRALQITVGEQARAALKVLPPSPKHRRTCQRSRAHVPN